MNSWKLFCDSTKNTFLVVVLDIIGIPVFPNGSIFSKNSL